jgi:hypothetical protein
MSKERLAELEARGWRLTRDGSTATALLAWEDPDDEGSGWELMVLHTAGHGSRFTLDASGAGLTERGGADAQALHLALTETLELLEHWHGELPDESDA